MYKRAIESVVLANDVEEQLPRGRGYLADQLQRAATSSPLNIADGAGELASREKESAAVLDVCVRLRLLDEER